jgi:hypothetical protein
MFSLALCCSNPLTFRLPLALGFPLPFLSRQLFVDLGLARKWQSGL